MKIIKLIAHNFYFLAVLMGLITQLIGRDSGINVDLTEYYLVLIIFVLADLLNFLRTYVADFIKLFASFMSLFSKNKEEK